MAVKTQFNKEAVEKLTSLFIVFLHSNDASDLFDDSDDSDVEAEEDTKADETVKIVPEAFCPGCAACQSCTPPPAVPSKLTSARAFVGPLTAPAALTSVRATPITTPPSPLVITRMESVRQSPAAETREAVEGRIVLADVFTYSADRLEGLLEETKLRLNRSMVKADRERLDDDRAAALDVYNVLVPYRGPVNQPAGPLRARQFPETLGDQVHVDVEADNRFYAVIIGINFTGVVRGHSQFDAICPQGVRLVKGYRKNSKADAEAVWRQAAYKGEIGMILPPAPPPVVLPVVPQFRGVAAE